MHEFYCNIMLLMYKYRMVIGDLWVNSKEDSTTIGIIEDGKSKSTKKHYQLLHVFGNVVIDRLLKKKDQSIYSR